MGDDERPYRIAAIWDKGADSMWLRITGELVQFADIAIRHAVDTSLQLGSESLLVHFADCGGAPTPHLANVLRSAQERTTCGVGAYFSGCCWGSPIIAAHGLTLRMAHPEGRFSLDGNAWFSAESGEAKDLFTHIRRSPSVLSHALQLLRQERERQYDFN